MESGANGGRQEIGNRRARGLVCCFPTLESKDASRMGHPDCGAEVKGGLSAFEVVVA